MKSLFKKLGNFFDDLGSDRLTKQRKAVYFIFEALALIGVLLLLGAPICVAPISTASGIKEFRITPVSLFDHIKLGIPSLLSFATLQLIMLLFVVLFSAIILYKIIKSLISLANEDEIYALAKSGVFTGSVGIFIYTVFSYLFSPINKLLGGYSLSSVNLFPIIYIAIICLLFAALSGIITSAKRKREDASAAFKRKATAERKKILKKLFGHQLELLLFALAAAGIAIYSMTVNIVTVKFSSPLATIPDFIFSGKRFLFEAASLTTKNERTLSFILSVLFIATLLFAFLSIVSFFSRSTLCSKLTIGSIITSSISCALVGLFGLYYSVVQSLNEEILLKLLGEYSILVEEMLEYKAESASFVYFFILIAVLIVCFIRRPYSKALKIEKKLYSSELSIIAPEVSISGNSQGAGTESAPSQKAPYPSESFAKQAQGAIGYFDPCPAFTEIDSKIPEFEASLEKKRQAIFEEPSLPRLVDFIVQYARDSRLHLFYTPESIATFLAGLGSTKLTILQGMSGTGKTSLPKIVAEALCSVCDVVEVESSWRDKNELLGYYNEFNKVYTPKKFTQALYRAALNADTLTFIVLDEMNLSRIEYYFSDFLSLMENEPDKRYLKLLNVSLARQNNGMLEGYAGLEDGHTLRIPQNVWFIGTANRDESTYDISDKVYDRAHTMNFDRRAPKPQYYSEPMEARYLPASALTDMFENAKTGVKFDIDSYPLVAKVEKLLAPYNISFGNRIAMQIESFVKIYASCFAVTDAVIHQALETILLSKVVKKLELKSIENKEELAAEFEKLQLSKCAKFIAELSED